MLRAPALLPVYSAGWHSSWLPAPTMQLRHVLVCSRLAAAVPAVPAPPAWLLLTQVPVWLAARTSRLANFRTFSIYKAHPDYKAHFRVRAKILVKKVRLIVVKLLYLYEPIHSHIYNSGLQVFSSKYTLVFIET